MNSESNLNLKNSGRAGAKGKELKIEKFKIPPYLCNYCWNDYFIIYRNLHNSCWCL